MVRFFVPNGHHFLGEPWVHPCILAKFTHSTWYSATRVQRQMGVDQTVPSLDGVHCDAPITAGVIKAVMSAWDRDRRLVYPILDLTSVRTTPEYQHWLRTEVWPNERPRRIALLRQLEGWDEEEEEAPILKIETPEVDFGTSEVETVSSERECVPRRKRVTKV